MTFYVAIADRRCATHEDIVKGCTFDDFREAKKFACKLAHDSDEAVLTNIDGEWIRVWKRDGNDDLLVTGELGAWIDAVPFREYLKK